MAPRFCPPRRRGECSSQERRGQIIEALARREEGLFMAASSSLPPRQRVRGHAPVRATPKANEASRDAGAPEKRNGHADPAPAGPAQPKGAERKSGIEAL